MAPSSHASNAIPESVFIVAGPLGHFSIASLHFFPFFKTQIWA